MLYTILGYTWINEFYRNFCTTIRVVVPSWILTKKIRTLCSQNLTICYSLRIQFWLAFDTPGNKTMVFEYHDLVKLK